MIIFGKMDMLFSVWRIECILLQIFEKLLDY